MIDKKDIPTRKKNSQDTADQQSKGEHVVEEGKEQPQKIKGIKNHLISAFKKKGKLPKDIFNEEQWDNIICTKIPREKLNKKKLRNSFLSGIPDNMRGEIWKYICRVEIEKNAHVSGIYLKLVATPNEEDQYCIQKDLARTIITGGTSYKMDPQTGCNKLFNVLMAYANFDREIGYCQGINYIAALLL